MARVLIAEDERTTRKILATALISHGHEVVLASDGLRALNLLDDDEDIELLVCDVMMPHLDGVELVTKLRETPHFRALPVLLISSKVELSELEHVLRLGNARFISKPIRPHRLQEEVTYLLEEAALAESGEAQIAGE
jgi:CheY-like chemotaxis protein